jgi:hypothetical protein
MLPLFSLLFVFLSKLYAELFNTYFISNIKSLGLFKQTCKHFSKFNTCTSRVNRTITFSKTRNFFKWHIITQKIIILYSRQHVARSMDVIVRRYYHCIFLCMSNLLEYNTDFDCGFLHVPNLLSRHTAGVTGRQGMLTPPRHLIPPLVYLEVCVCRDAYSS